MAYVLKSDNNLGKWVVLTEKKEDHVGYFEVGTKVKITNKSIIFGYTFEDEHGNKVIGEGFDGFKLYEA